MINECVKPWIQRVSFVCLIVIVAICIWLWMRYPIGGAGGYLVYKAYVDSGTVTLVTGTKTETWQVQGEWEKSFNAYEPEAFTTPRRLIVTPDGLYDSNQPTYCEVLFSGKLLDEDSVEGSESSAICRFESWDQ